MKIILLIALMLTSLFADQSQIVLGTYSTLERAEVTQSEFERIIQKDPKFQAFLEKNSIKTMKKKDGKYFIVTLQPIQDIVTQYAILNKVKKTKYKDAFVLKLFKPTTHKVIPQKKPQVDIIITEDEEALFEEEPSIEEVPLFIAPKKEEIKNKKEPIVIKETNIRIPNHTPEAQNIVLDYLYQIIAIIVLLFISVLYLIKKRKQQEDEDTYMGLSTNTIDEYEDIEDIEDIKKAQNSQSDIDEYDNEPMVMRERNEEITFDGLDKIEEIQDNFSLTSNIIKKNVAHHEKITKGDFKDFANSRILIAEDNSINQKVIKGLLSDSGIQMIVVDDGQEALNFLEKDSEFCIILMDVHMPNMDGFEASKIIRSNPNYNHITIIALSGDVASDDVKKMKESGMQENLAKPLKMDTLYDMFSAYAYEKEDIILLNEDIKIDKKVELNIETGLEVCAGDEAFYKEILTDFINDYSDSTLAIQNYLNNNKFDEVDRLLLDITGVAANIGANFLQEIVSDLKQALLTPKDRKYIKLFKEYAKHYESLEKEVNEYLLH